MKRPQIFLFHFAGGNCYSFQFLTPLLSGFEVIIPELPGRGRRMHEPLLNEFDDAAVDLYNQVISRLSDDTPFLLYGHSMGASFVLRLANMLEAAGRYPAGVVVSGNAGPGIEKPGRRVRYLLNKPEFLEELKKLGGLPQELIDNEELFGFFEPVLRADFEITERNNLAMEPAIQAPLYAVMGSLESDVDKIDNWSGFVQHTFHTEVLEGDHFFIRQHPRRMADIISTFYRRMQTMPQQ
ncbi:thioesterase II family protein [Chitinophaga sp. HK235]|uniref:thioesterase II family protein n=1 Tax=Chitinophaga sp. HK235 TaxID=2952571 RepID=UPI001BA71305|nr:alpha/beta fold hydrolase [Chitinophaga sp. HK235]